MCEIVICFILFIVLYFDLDIGCLIYFGCVMYNCDLGYEFFGLINVIECLEEGLWDFLFLECLFVECGDLGLIVNGYVIFLFYMFKSVVFYKCNYGYVLRGNGLCVC